jgi:phospholipase C
MRDAFGNLLRGALRLVAPLLPRNWRRVARELAEPPVPTPRDTVRIEFDPGVENLAKVDHIVVLMLENRSFDHMLGYLSLTGGRSDVDGLREGMSNEHAGTAYPIHHLPQTAFEDKDEAEDPCHSAACVCQQLADGNGGFVANYAAYVAGLSPQPDPLPDPGLVMGYYDGDDLPVYDLLAREFCVCDRWFSSVPGATWPNRMYALTGGAPSADDRGVPLYNRVSFARHLDARGVDWRWYSFDPGSLRLADREYGLDPKHHHHFAYVDRRKLSVPEEALGAVFEHGSFLDDAANGTLPPVSWIDPHWKDMRVFGPDSNDDHPPSDVLAGQGLVLDVYHALRNSPAWERCLLIVTYDEHGGFFDHVAPPAATPPAAGADGSADPAFRRYGVRVPAFVISPFVTRGSVAPREPVFDHTSILKTILLRFCRDGDRIPDMGARVTAAHHLGGLLSEPLRTSIAAHDEAAAVVTDWRQQLAAARLAPEFDPPLPPRRLTDLQTGILHATRALRDAGLPAGHP